MNCLVKFPDWGAKMFSHLCFSQVKEQLPENLISLVSYSSNPTSFICNGELFAYTHHSNLYFIEPSPFLYIPCN